MPPDPRLPIGKHTTPIPNSPVLSRTGYVVNFLDLETHTRTVQIDVPHESYIEPAFRLLYADHTSYSCHRPPYETMSRDSTSSMSTSTPIVIVIGVTPEHTPHALLLDAAAETAYQRRGDPTGSGRIAGNRHAVRGDRPDASPGNHPAERRAVPADPDAQNAVPSISTPARPPPRTATM